MSINPFKHGLVKYGPPLEAIRSYWESRSRYLWLPVLLLAALGLGVVSGFLATYLSVAMFLMLVLGIVLFFVAFSMPEFVVLLILVITSSIINPDDIPSIRLGFEFTAAELLLLLLLGLVLTRALTHRTEGWMRTPLDWPIFLFFIASTVSFLNAMISMNADRGLLVPIWRLLFLYLIFFAVTNLIRTRRQFSTVAGGILLITTVMAALMLVQGVVGPGVKVVPSITVGTAEALDQEFSDVARVLPPGVALVFIVFFPALLLYGSTKENQWRFVVPLLLLPPAIVFTFNRTWWFGMVLSMVILPFVVPSDQRKRIWTLLGVLFIVFSVFGSLLLSYYPRTESMFEAVVSRISSVFVDSNTLQEDQSRRLCEVESALGKIQRYPLLGVGPGGVIHTDMCTDRLPRYVHNAYLYIMADLGALGMLPFIAFVAIYLYRGLFIGRTLKSPELRVWTLGLSLGFIALLVASMAGPEFMSWHTTPFIGVMLGLNEVAIWLDENSPLGSAEI